MYVQSTSSSHNLLAIQKENTRTYICIYGAFITSHEEYGYLRPLAIPSIVESLFVAPSGTKLKKNSKFNS